MNDNKFCPLISGECKGTGCQLFLHDALYSADVCKCAFESIGYDMDKLQANTNTDTTEIEIQLERIANGLDRHNELLQFIAEES